MTLPEPPPADKGISSEHAASPKPNPYLILVIAIILALGLVLVRQLQWPLRTNFPTQVTNLNDNGPGSLRDAITHVVSGATITFASTLHGTITLINGELAITRNLSLRGPGAPVLAISGGDTSRVFSVSAHIVVTISGVTIKGGRDGGITNAGTLSLVNSIIASNRNGGNGGGIDNSGTLTLTHSTVSGNRAGEAGGGVYNSGTLTLTGSTVSGNQSSYGGGGIESSGTLTLSNTTISGNTANLIGGGIYSGGTLTLDRSTIADNRANFFGGGIYSQGPLTLINSTISGNHSKENGGGVATEYGEGNASILFCTIYGNTARVGGGIANYYGTLFLWASIVAGNHAQLSPDASGRLTLFYPSLLQNTTGTFIDFGTEQHDPAATTLAKRSIFGQAPRLGPLQDNSSGAIGGFEYSHTQTHALLPGSPAIDQIPARYSRQLTCDLVPIECEKPTYALPDQRGVARPKGPGFDLGAYEYTPSGRGLSSLGQ